MTLDVQTIADQIEEVSHQHGEPYTLLDRRLEALQLMADQKMPTIPRYHFEDWPLLSDQHWPLRIPTRTWPRGCLTPTRM